MASAVATQKFLANAKIEFWDHDPGSTSAILLSADGGTTVKSVDMSKYGVLVAGAIQTVIGSSSGITKIEIVASAAATLTSEEVIKDSGTIDADALADWYVLECTAEEIAQIGAAAGKELRYAGLRITQSNAGDEAIGFYLGLEPRTAYKDLTAASNIS